MKKIVLIWSVICMYSLLHAQPTQKKPEPYPKNIGEVVLFSMYTAICGAYYGHEYYTHRTGKELLDIGLHSQRIIPLYGRVEALQSIDLIQLKTAFQVGGSCGWYAIFNALALDSCVKNKIKDEEWKEYVYELCQYKIGRESLACVVKNTFLPQVNDNQGAYQSFVDTRKVLEGITSEEQFKVARKLGLRNFCFFDIDSEHEMFFTPSDSSFYARRIALCDLKNLFLHTSKKVYHMFIGMPSDEAYHSVLLTCIKRPGSKPLLIYMDSNNQPLGKQRGDIHRDRGFFVEAHQKINSYTERVEKVILALAGA